MASAARAGISASEFWEMTPSELFVYIDAYRRRMEEETELQGKMNMILAYYISRWVWQKRVDVKRYISEKKAHSVPMSDEEMFERVKVLNAVMGGSVEEALS